MQAVRPANEHKHASHCGYGYDSVRAVHQRNTLLRTTVFAKHLKDSSDRVTSRGCHIKSIIFAVWFVLILVLIFLFSHLWCENEVGQAEEEKN